MRGLGGAGGPGGPPAGMMQNMQNMQRGMMGQMGAGGGMRGGMMGGMMGGQLGADEEEDSEPINVTALVEVERKDIDSKGQSLGKHVRIKHHVAGGGMTHLAYPAIDVQWKIDKLDTVAKRFAARKAEIKDDDAERAGRLFELAQWALEHDLLDRVDEIMAEVAKIDSKNPVVVAFQAAQKGIERKLTQDDPAISWREKLDDFNHRSSDHYTLLYDSKKEADADRILRRLEHNYRGFFYWFALQGRVLNVPGHRLVAFLVDNKDTFDNQRSSIFDNPAMVEDAFYARRDNLAVISGKRLDEPYKALEEIIKRNFKDWTSEVLIKGKASGARLGLDYDTACRAETYELVHQAMKEEAELAAVSYEGTRQLVTAAGLLPAGLQAPTWIDFGLASLLDTPRGAYWPSIGGPNLQYLAKLKYWAKSKNKNLETNALAALKGVVTDRYFHEVKEGKGKESQLNRARIMSWALAFFLAKKHPDGLVRYYEELSNMPRDLDLDGDVLLGAFARAFGLTEAGKPDTLDTGKAELFARKWYDYIQHYTMEVDASEFETSQPKTLKPGEAPAGNRPRNNQPGNNQPGNRD